MTSQEFNTPAAIINATNPTYSIATDRLLFVQSVVVDGQDRVWALDTGRPRVNGTYLLATVPGGPKLVGFDLRRGSQFAYITDSSPQRPGIVVVNLQTGASWRHLDGNRAVSVVPGFVPMHDGGECGLTAFDPSPGT